MRKLHRLDGKPWTDPADTRKRIADGWRLWRDAEILAHREQARRNRIVKIAAELAAYRIERLQQDSLRELEISRANAKRARRAQRRLGNA